MDILYVGTLPPHPGGSGVVGGQLVAGLADRGHRVRAVAPMTETALRHGDAFAAQHRGVAITRYVVARFQVDPHDPDEGYRDAERAAAGQAIERAVSGGLPQVLIIGRESMVWPAQDAAARWSIPTVLIVHSETSAGAFGDAKNDTFRVDLLERFTRNDLVIVVASRLAERFRALGCRVAVVENGLDLELFAPGPPSATLAASLGIRSDDIVVIHASTLKDVKRPMDVIESAAIALAQVSRLRYVIVGSGVLREAMGDRTVALGIGERLTFVPWVDHHEMPEYLRLADISVLPSETEAMALVGLETMGVGRVLLASDIPAFRATVDDGVDGVLFGRGDVAGLAAATVELALDPARRAEVGACARARVSRHGLGAAIGRYEALLSEVIA
ncbi:MAG: glycosyltransferase family 4 protein [Candidatus Limnocylindrales bacterium]